MKSVLFKGCGTAIVTPFNENGVNYDVLGLLIEKQISEGIDSIIVCGTTGESSTMTEAEKCLVIKFVVEQVNKRAIVIAGTGCNDTYKTIEMTKYAESIGVDGVLIVTPYYNKTTQEGLFYHYKEINDSVNIPIILYNVPSRTGINILPETCKKLSKLKNVVGIKEASGNISQVIKIISLCGDDLYVYSGNDDQVIPILSLGGMGAISVLSNIAPKYVHDMIYDYFNGDVEEAKLKQLNCINLINVLFSEVNPIPIKEALNILGYDCGIPRLPLIKMSDIGVDNLKHCLEDFNKYLIQNNK